MFNPIEYVWSVVKADVKRNMAENMADMLNGELRGSLAVMGYRLQFLERFMGLVKIWLCLIYAVLVLHPFMEKWQVY